MSFVDFKKLLDLDYLSFKQKLSSIHSIKHALPEIKKEDGYLILF